MKPLLPAHRRPALAALIVLTALWALFFWRLLTPADGDRALFAPGDFPIHFYAFSSYQMERLWEGELPLWNPYNYGGEPFAANPQFATWYPPRWIAGLLAGPDGWRIEAHQLEVAAHYWLGSLTMAAFLYVLVRRTVPALLGSLIWTYGGYLTGYPMLQPSIAEGLVWLPLALLGVHLSVHRPRWPVRGVVLSGAMLALVFLAGHPQTAAYAGYLTLAYLLTAGWMAGLRLRALAWRAALWAVTGAALAAVQLLPAYELLQRSYRAENFHYLDKAVGFSFAELAQVLWPRLFGAEWWPLYAGVIGLVLVVTAILRPRREYGFWLVVLVVGLWLTVGGGSALYDLFYVFAPGWNVFRQQERAAVWVAFAVSVLATFQLSALFDAARPVDRRLLWLARGHLALTALAFSVVVITMLLRSDNPRSVTSDALGFVLGISLLFNGWLTWEGTPSAQTKRGLVTLGLGAILVLDLFSLGMHSPNFVPDTPENRVAEPDNLDLLRTHWTELDYHVDGAAGLQARGTYWRIPDIFGAVPFQLETLEELRHIRVDRRWEVFAVRYATMIAEVPDNVPVRVVGTGVNYDGEEYTLYELENPRPFAHLVYQVRVSEDGIAGAREIMLEPWIDLREIGVVSEPLPFDLSGQRPPDATVRAFKMVQPEYMEMEVSTSTPALLTVAVADYPGWEATVNGQRVDIIDTYAGLIGIPIPAGTGQKVTLRFFPRSVLVGGIISALALVTVVGYGGVEWWRSRRVARQPGRTRGGHA